MSGLNASELLGNIDDKTALNYIANNYYIPFLDRDVYLFLNSKTKIDWRFTKNIMHKHLRNVLERRLSVYSNLEDITSIVKAVADDKDYALLQFFVLFYTRNKRDQIKSFFNSYWPNLRRELEIIPEARLALSVARPHFSPYNKGTRIKYFLQLTYNVDIISEIQYLNKYIAEQVLLYLSPESVLDNPPLKTFHELAKHDLLLACSFLTHIANSNTYIIERTSNIQGRRYVQLGSNEFIDMGWDY